MQTYGQAVHEIEGRLELRQDSYLIDPVLYLLLATTFRILASNELDQKISKQPNVPDEKHVVHTAIYY